MALAFTGRPERYKPAHDEAGTGFIIIELDLAITFCEIGLTTNRYETAEGKRGECQASLGDG